MNNTFFHFINPQPQPPPPSQHRQYISASTATTQYPTHYMTQINEKQILHIEQVTGSISCLYFTNEFNQKINIPNSFALYVATYCENKYIKQIQSPADMTCYVLSCIDNYIMEMNGEQILSLTSQRIWCITNHQ